MKKLVRKLNGYIDIFDGNGFNYPIEASRCGTEDEVLSWIYHLSEKSWVTTEHIRQFIRLVAPRYLPC